MLGGIFRTTPLLRRLPSFTVGFGLEKEYLYAANFSVMLMGTLTTGRNDDKGAPEG